MSNYGYTVFLKDFMSSKLMKIATTANKTYTKVTKFQTTYQNKVFQGAKTIDGLNTRLEKLNRQRGGATSIKDIRKLNGEIRKTEKSLHKLESLPPNSFLDRIRKARKNLGGMATTAVAGVGAIGVYNGLKGLYNLGADAEQSRLKFETLLGSVTKAKLMIDKINGFANATPFNNKDLKKNAELLLSFGSAEQKVLPTLKMIGDISGGNRDKLNSLTLAYAQMSSTGRLMGQDLLQMINAGFNPLQTISEKTGKSMAVLKKEMSQGRISSKMVEEAFVTATAKGGRFHGMLKKMSTSSSGLASTLIGGWQTKLAGFSEKYFLPLVNKGLKFGLQLMNGFEKIEQPILRFFRAFKPITDSLGMFITGMIGVSSTGSVAGGVIDFLAGAFNFISPIIEFVSNGIGGLITILEPLAPVLKVVGLGVLGVKGIMALWNVVMWTNPITLIVSGLVLFTGAVVTAYKKVAWFRGGMLALWEIIKGFGTLLKIVILDRLKEFLNGIVGIGKALFQFFNGDYKKAWETSKKATDDFFGEGTKNKTIKTALETGKKASQAYHKGIAEINAKKKTKTSIALSAVKKKQQGTEINLNPQGDLVKDTSLQKGIDTINGGGTKHTNIQVHFDKLVETVIIKAQNIEKGVDETVDTLKEGVLGVINSINQTQTA